MKTVSMNDLEKVAGGEWPIEGAITPLQPTMEQQLNEVAPDLALSYLETVDSHSMVTAVKLAWNEFFG